ncbi:hypothetical protein SEUCBS140593_000837 [Sporothrix eucalyptigena]|uniref:C6 zinc finger domain containing protein n=1 Tax=Sporothrix eucalyptigena TaxID=1812306 RepID=A0ABP0AT75_9PEZI
MSPTDSTITEITASDTHEEQLSEHIETQEEAWPGDRNPSANDAAEAYSPLNIDFLPTFRNAVLAKSQPRAVTSVAGIDTIGGILARSMAIDPLFWPMGMFSTSSTPDNIDQRISQCNTGFLQTTIFLRDAPVSLFTHSPRPQYFTLSLAAIGSLLAEEPAEVSAQHWHDAVHLMTGELEIDNREARSFNLLKAWLLLETYAVLSSDPSVWKQANMVHGCVETVDPPGPSSSARE